MLLSRLKPCLGYKVLFFLLIITILSCNIKSQHPSSGVDKKINIGGSFENREFTYYGIPKVTISVDTSPAWTLSQEKLMITGVVYQSDNVTPAADVLLYYYHTNPDGRYVHKDDEQRSMPPNEKGQTHGFIRGWVKTDANGRYTIYTIRPGTYPTMDEADHIHVTIKENNDIPEYYIDDFTFDDDKLLTSAKRLTHENRGGSGVLRLIKKDGLLIGERDIYLGLNIPNYPINKNTILNSGKQIGEEIVSFILFHAWGKDTGTRVCPVCKYGWYHGILYFVGTKPNWEEIKKWLLFLEAESNKRKDFLKVYFIYGNPTNYNKNVREEQLSRLGRELNLKNIALTFVPTFSDTDSEVHINKIDESKENTFLVYKRNKIIGHYSDLKPTQTNFNIIREKLDHSINEFFYLPMAKNIE
jgi:protocatechuate 3,4-dioxygenase beta subunit